MATYTYGSGPDNVTASAAGDQLFGGGGDDTLTAIAGGDQLYGDTGDDVLNGASGNDLLSGGGDSDAVQHNVMNGFGGDDTIISGSMGDQVFGGDGNDQVQITAMRTGQVIDGGAGTDTLMLLVLPVFSDPIFIQMGSTFQPTVGGVAGATYTNFENLYVIGGTGTNHIIGGAGDDTIMNSYNNVATFQGGSLSGGDGTDEISFYGLPASGSGTMQLNGGKGVDTLVWANGLASFGTLEIDLATGTMTADGTVFAHFTGFEAYKIQTYQGATGVITYTGGAGADTLDLYATSSTISTGGGDDVINLRSGQSEIHAGFGDDKIFVDFTNATSQVLNGDGGNDLIQSGSGQESLYGGTGSDTLTSYNGRSHLDGGAGNDVLYLSASSSTAGTGPAQITGGAGRDALTLEFSVYSAAYTADFSKATVVLVDGTRITAVEAVTFSSGSGNDKLTASNDAAGYTANRLLGNGGDDTLHANTAGASLDGGVGNDLLVGSDAADYLNGNLGNDVLRGGAGNDSLVGGFGKDVMTGGLGADHFLYVFGTQSGNSPASRDLITDFTQADHDRIDLSGCDADANVSNGKTPFTFIGAAGFHNVAGELRYHKVDLAGTAHDVTLITGDTNGDGTADFQIALKGLIALHLSDFLLV